MDSQQKYSKYTFFWNGIYSQWYLADIVIDEIKYNCCEQYMMAQKARTFGDFDTAMRVMRESSPREQKTLGRQVKNFNPDIWNAVARDIVFRGNMAKFSDAHMDLQDQLYQTAGTLLVEASPYDKVWGIGVSEAEAINLGSVNWPGTNWLGRIITEVRECYFPEGTLVFSVNGSVIE